MIVQLRNQIHQMKVRSGLKDVYQNNLHTISPQSLRTFLNMAQVHLSDPEFSEKPRATDDNEEIEDVEVIGIQKFKSILREESRKKLTSQFIWGSMKAINNDQLVEQLQ